MQACLTFGLQMNPPSWNHAIIGPSFRLYGTNIFAFNHLRMMATVLKMKTRMDMDTATCWELWNQIGFTTIVWKYKVGVIPNQNFLFQSKNAYQYQFLLHIHVCRVSPL